MVELEEVEDQDLTQAEPGPVKDEDYDSADFVSTDSELSDDSENDDDDRDGGGLSESLSERIYALRDILPAPIRHRLSSAASSLYSLGTTTASWGGKGLYVLSTSAMLVMVPYAIAYVEEQQILEQEREFRAREGLGDALTPGVTSAMGQPAGGGAASGAL